MDDLARRFLGLALRLHRMAPALLEAYAGPAELREAIATEPMPQARELHDEAMAIEDVAAAMQPISGSEARRGRWLTEQAGAVATVARVLDSEEIALPDLVESLVGLPAAREPEASLLAEHRVLDAALPPGPSVRMRLARHRAETAIPADQVTIVAEQLLAALRRRSQEDLALPAGEALALEAAHEAAEPWHVRTDFEPPLRSRMLLNAGRDWALDRLLAIAAGEGYPGGHARRVARTAVAEHGRTDEVLCWLVPTPDSAIAAGIAAAGREVLLGDFEVAAELRRIGHELGLHWDAEREIEVARSRERLGPAIANAALLLHHDGLPRSEAQAYLAEMALLESEEVDGVLAALDDPLRRVEPFARAQMPRLVRDWLATVGQTGGLRRLLSEQLTPGSLRDEAEAPARDRPRR